MYTSDDLINYIKLYGAVPSQQPAFSNDELLDITNNELLTIIVPFIMDHREDYFVTSTDTTITRDDNDYGIPSKAVGGVIREIKLVRNDARLNLPRIDLDQLHNHSEGFYIEDNNIKIINVNNFIGYTIRIYYYRRPNLLIRTADSTNGAAKVGSISGTTVTVSTTVPSVWSTSTDIDFIQATPPFNYLQEEETITGIAGSDITFASVPSTLAVGDWLCASGYSTIPTIPAEVHYLLAQGVVIKVLESLADQKGVRSAVAKYKQMEERISNLLSPRVQGEPKRIVNSQNFLDMPRRRYYP
jgi:hypothetical protein